MQGAIDDGRDAFSDLYPEAALSCHNGVHKLDGLRHRRHPGHLGADLSEFQSLLGFRYPGSGLGHERLGHFILLTEPAQPRNFAGADGDKGAARLNALRT